LLLGSLSISIVISSKEISLLAGTIQAFERFFSYYNMSFLLPYITAGLVIGGIGSVNNWTIAPIRGLLYATKDNNFPVMFEKTNKRNSPYILLIFQAMIVTVLTLLVYYLPSVSSFYWFLTALASQLYMVMYIILFSTAIYLKKRKKLNNKSVSIISFLGIISCTFTFIIGFFPPSCLISDIYNYVCMLILFLLVFLCIPFFLSSISRTKF
jgi:amino acid transporter